MNRKQSHDPIGSYINSQNQKINYQVNSPYIELLEGTRQSKKKGYGIRYDTKNIRSFTNYVKPSPASISSIFAQGPKPFKSVSTQKVKVGRSVVGDKKKRSRTEQAQEKMHESMCFYPSMPQKNMEDPISKSLYYGQAKISSEFHPNMYFQQLSNHKNRRKRHLSQNKHNYSDSHNNINASQSNGLLQNLQIKDIDSLIMLIDNCISQANQYISFLSQKLQSMKQQLIMSKCQINQLEQLNKKQVQQMHQKQKQFQTQIKQRLNQSSSQKKQNGFQVKNLLQIIEKISQQNQLLRNQISYLKEGKIIKKPAIDGTKQIQKCKQTKERQANRDYFKEIHSKIDILNISIDNNHTYNQTSTLADARQKRDRDTAKKYKFIKPKGK